MARCTAFGFPGGVIMMICLMNVIAWMKSLASGVTFLAITTLVGL